MIQRLHVFLINSESGTVNMKWRNPKKELPKDGDIVWIMLKPHKDRGSLINSSPSIEIVCGWAYSNSKGAVIIDNNDELGMGSVMWDLRLPEGEYTIHGLAIGWMPVEEMIYPSY